MEKKKKKLDSLKYLNIHKKNLICKIHGDFWHRDLSVAGT